MRLAEDFIEYLQQKHPAIRSEDLCFEPEGGYARSIVLYMLQEDFERPTSSAPKKKAADLHAKFVNISEISRNHSNWKDTFAGRELGSSSGGWCIKNPIILGAIELSRGC